VNVSDLRVVGNYISGKWVEAEHDGHLDIENPSTGGIIGKVPLSVAGEADRAV
jgi:acyl-CoA reductase-like NAD-dependent aldehyde dehydrogenase